MLALVPASYTLSPHSANTTSMPLVPSVVSLHSVQFVAEPWYSRAMASSTVSASTVLVNSVTSYATTVNIICSSFLYRTSRSRMTSTTRRLPRASATTVAALPAHHLSEWPRLKIEIALDLQPQGAANRFELSKALAKCEINGSKTKPWREDVGLMAFLNSL